MRFSQQDTTRPEIKKFFNFDTPASMTLPYPGLDGHPGRITPIPVSLPIRPIVEKERLAGEPAAEEEEAESAIQKGSQLSGTSRSTIGNTFIPPKERARIREEVRAVIHQTFPGIQLSTVHNSEPRKSGVQPVNMTNLGQNSAPMAIARSEVSVASTRSNARAGENQNSFSRMMTSAGAVNSAQTFANV